MNLESTVDLARAAKLYPAVILHGGEPEQRRAAALRLAQTLLCEEATEVRACGACRHCRRIVWPGSEEDRFHPDFSVLERDLKTATSVEATKTFLRQAQVSPFEARGQVFVIADAETLGGGAANALLKTLEEPPDQAPRHFLLLSPSQFDLLPTVRSRSLPVFLGVTDTLDPERVEELSTGFSASLRDFAETKDPAALLSAAEQLSRASGWKDPRAAQPWSLAAAAVRASLQDLPPEVDRGRVLALAEDLLMGWQIRMRGIQASRILEGLVVRNLSAAVR